jgi:hypothetical protein
MLEKIKRWWERLEPYLTAATHFDLLFVRTGLLGFISTGVVGIVAGTLAWLHAAPAYLVLLAGMIGMGAALFLANQSLQLITRLKAPASISRQQARRLDSKDPGGIRLGGNVATVITVLASALIIVGGLYATNAYSTWRSDIEGTYLSVAPGPVIVNLADKARPLEIRYTIINRGNLPALGSLHQEAFAYPSQQLSIAEEDNYFRILDASITAPINSGLNIFAHSNDISSSAEDHRFSKEQLDEFQANQLKIYLFIEYKYSISGYTRITESCWFYQQTDYPSVHLCYGHRGSRWE